MRSEPSLRLPFFIYHRQIDAHSVDQTSDEKTAHSLHIEKPEPRSPVAVRRQFGPMIDGFSELRFLEFICNSAQLTRHLINLEEKVNAGGEKRLEAFERQEMETVKQLGEKRADYGLSKNT